MSDIFYRKTSDQQIERAEGYSILTVFTPAGQVSYGVDGYYVDDGGIATVHGYIGEDPSDPTSKEVVSFPATLYFLCEAREVWTSQDEASYREDALERAQTEKMFKDKAERILKSNDKGYD